MTTEAKERLRQLERENAELKRANEILRAASIFFYREPLESPHDPPPMNPQTPGFGTRVLYRSRAQS